MSQRNTLARWASCLLLVGILGLTPGCGGGSDKPGGGQTQAATPTLSAQPQPQTALEGASATFNVTATASNGTLSYQWKKGTADLAGKTSASLVLNPVSLADAGSYTVVVTNTLNGTTASATSSAALLTVNPAPATPSIATQPQTQTVLEGGSATLSVVATASNGTLSYQWMKGTTALVGKTSASLSLNPVLLTDAGSYTVVVTNTLSGATASTTSATAVLAVNALATTPIIGTQPLSLTVLEGGSATFSVAATANGTLSCQWMKGTTVLAGQTSASLVLNPVALTDAGSYTVVVTNTLSGTTASTTSGVAILTVDAATPKPTIDVQPQSKTVTVPDGATFSVTASGTGLTYEWRKDGTKIDGATGTSYTLTATDLRETSAQFSVVVTNVGGSTTSENATLSVMAPSPTYAGDPVPVPARTLEVLPAYTPNTAAPNGIFRFGFDSDLRNPVWTAYANFRFLAPFTIGSGRDYQADDRLTNPVQVGDFYFATSGMSRGHQVMRSDLGYRYGQQATDDSNRMSNMAPQLEAHNGQIWADLEQAVGGENPTAWIPGIADTFGRIWIYTGPIFSNAPSRISTSNVAIPTAFYKIIVREKSPGVPQATAVLIPHQPVPPKADLWKYVTSVARVETLAKLDLFPTLPTTAPADFKTDVDVRGWGAPFEATSKPSVHMVEPSWDTSVSVGTTVTFTGAASSTTGTVSSPTWTFGSEGTANGMATTHTFNSPGTVSVSFSVADGSAVSNSITRVITVTGGNAAPTITAIGNQTTAQDTLKSLTFTVNDDSTAAGSILVTATSNNQTLLPDANVAVSNSTGTCTLSMTPAAGQTGTATITITAKDGDNATTTQTLDLTVSTGGGGGQPVLIISQYYENNSPNRWIEVTNVGTATYDSTGATKHYLGLLANPFNASGGTYNAMQLVPSLVPGASILFANSATPTTPVASAITGTPVVSSSTTSFNGDDIPYLSTNGTAGLSTSWAARTDVLGVNAASWTGTATTTASTAAAAGYRTSWVRNATTLTPNVTFTLGEWTKITTATVDVAPSGDTNRLGEHLYNH